MLVEYKIHWVELVKKEYRNKWQSVFPVVKSVAPSSMLRLNRKNSVGLKLINRCDRVHHKENTCHLNSLDKLDFTRICKELTKWFAMNLMQGMQNRTEKKWNLDEGFFEKGNKYAWDKCKSIEKNTRELHLELVGDKVTYVRVYWLRSQVRSLDHRSYSSFKLKMGLPFFV